MPVDLAGVHQRDLLTANGKPGGETAKLRAISFLRSHPKLGRIWLTECDCGNHREVSTEAFQSGRIRKCQTCVNPAMVASQMKLNARREELRNQFYSDSFRATWRAKLAKFDPMRMLLFETIMGRELRSSRMSLCGALEMQAADIVLRTPEDEIDIEIGSFGQRRIGAAMDRLAVMGIELPEGMTPKSFSFE